MDKSRARNKKIPDFGQGLDSIFFEVLGAGIEPARL